MASAAQGPLRNFPWARGTAAEESPNIDEGVSQSRWSRWTSAAGSYMPLRSSERASEDETYFVLSRWERLLGFGVCLLGAAACFLVAFLRLPLIALRPSKFALAFSLGSLLVMFGFAVLLGPIAHIKHLFSKERLPFTFAYVTSLGLTIYFSVGRKSYLGSLIAAIIQVVALVSYVLAYFPGGVSTLRFGGQIALRGAGNLLPV